MYRLVRNLLHRADADRESILLADTCLSFLNEDPFTRMTSASVSCCMRDLTMTIAKGFFLAVVLPVAPALLFNIPMPSVLALIASTFVIEYGAAAAGIGMGLPPLYVLYAVTSIALGVTLTLFDIFDLLGRNSERVSGFLAKSSERAGRSVFLKKYGIYGLVPCVITLGFYVCPPVSWVMGWQKNRSMVLIMGGYIGISVVTILTTLGFFKIMGIQV